MNVPIPQPKPAARHRHAAAGGLLRRVGTAALAVAMTSAISLLALALPASAAGPVYVATDGTDDAGCGASADDACATIDHALEVAASGGTIVMAPGTYSEQNRITSPVTITGDGAGTVTVVGPVDNADPTFLIGSEGPITVTLQDMTIKAGPSGDSAVAAHSASVVTLNAVTVTSDPGNSGAVGIDVADGSTVSIVGATVTGNDSGIQMSGGSTVTADHAEVTDNVSGGIVLGALGGDLSDPDTLTMTNSTVAHNGDREYGGGVGIVVGTGSAELTDSTISDNAMGLLLFSGSVTMHRGAVTDNTGVGVGALGLISDAPPSITLDGTHITGNGGSASLVMGGVTAINGSVTATGVTVSGNAPFGITVGGGDLTLTDSVVRDTRGMTLGGDVPPLYADGAGIVAAGFNFTPLGVQQQVQQQVQPQASLMTVSHSDITGNGYGMVLYGADAQIDESTIADNDDIGLAIAALPEQDGALATVGGRLVLTHSTVAGNRGAGPADLAVVLGSGEQMGKATGADVSGIDAGPGAQLVLGGSIVASPNDTPACGSYTVDIIDGSELTITDGGYNVSSDDSCGLNADTSLPGVDPVLEDLADNAGPAGSSDGPLMKTMLPSLTSPALDLVPADAMMTLPDWAADVEGIDPALCGDDAIDQVGTARPQGKACDAGAAERVIPPLTVTTTSLPGGMVGVQYPTTTLHATGWYGGPYFWEITDGALPDGLTLDQDAGTISGTPRASGTFTFTVKASMPGDPDTATLSITIADAPVTTVTSTATQTATSTATATATVTDTATETSTPATSTAASTRSSTRPPATTPTISSSTGPELADTGVDARPGLAIGGGALLLGLGLTLLARRRRDGGSHQH